MHPEVRKEGPGDCPKCGMHLEPLAPSGGEAGEEQAIVRSLSVKFWAGIALAAPVAALALGEMLPALYLGKIISPQVSGWLQFLFATPVVFWAGGFSFVKAWQAL